MSDQNNNGTHKLVREAYADAARRQSPCCGTGSPCCGDPKAYTVPDGPVPEAELGLSCGNPLAFGYINKGDVVLDLGSGAGKDVFQAAQKVGDAGRALGVDMTGEMIDLARRNALKFRQTTGLKNVEFRQGLIEDLPVEDASVDVVISNCVINLSPDKPKVFREVHRVLKPGGRMTVSDIVLNRPLPPSVRDDPGFYAACIAGALLREDYLRAIGEAGFRKIEVLADSSYQASCACDDPIVSSVSDAMNGVASSITVRAVK
ncbi:MAG TPA: arsenite methyltransferase [Phycisphaerae bacterium]|nr:arsenite methyltransferase [Phycisphaerae bacterium]